jgi:hypothetical protein
MISSHSAAHNLPGSPALPVLIQFAYLQALDVLTTIAFLDRHVAEANPLLRVFVERAPSPLAALLWAKALALALGGGCLLTGRTRVLSRANLFFAALIVWNLVALIGAG